MTTLQPAVVATHGHCFDGLASAVMFTYVLQHIEPEAMKGGIVYKGQAYDPGKNGVDPLIFQGAPASAILDFRYTPTSLLTWYFDHHASAFVTEADRTHFQLLAERKRGFYDATYGSCTKLIADVAREQFALDISRFDTLVRWAHMIDSAAFPTAQMAVERVDPAMKMLAVIEQQGDDPLLTWLVQQLLREPFDKVTSLPEITNRYAPLEEAYRKQVEAIRTREQLRDKVVVVDMLDRLTETVVKFVTYADFPDVPYSVVLSRTERRCKISVGYNPWCKVPRTQAINAICERYGGGGHPVVGAVALKADLEECRRIADEIVVTLNS